MLNETKLIELLQRHALLTPAEGLDRALQITRVDRRNENYRIQIVGARDLFVKQGHAAASTGSMAREAAVYELLAAPAVQRHVGRYLIRYLGHDAASRVVMVEGVSEAEDLLAYHLRTGRLSTRLAAQLGVALGSLHCATRSPAPASRAPLRISETRPWVFDLPRPGVELLREASAVNLEMLRILQSNATFERELEALESEWRSESLIHGDMKLENCLTHPLGRRGARALKLVDWEHGGVGDACWDVACVLGSYLALWVSSIPMPDPRAPHLLAGRARFPLTGIQRVLRGFVASYARAAELEPRALPSWLHKTVRMTAAHLVQAAYEHAACTNELTAPVLALIQMALNILEQPRRATRDLLGLEVVRA
jgi:aminoglycoside phosphotransferase (APT) family kinase protein